MFENDTGLLGHTLHDATEGVFVTWKDMFNQYYGEECLVSKLKAYNNIREKAADPFPTAYPIVTTQEDFGRTKYLFEKYDHPCRAAPRSARCAPCERAPWHECAVARAL
jgi:hypothetical protein